MKAVFAFLFVLVAAASAGYVVPQAYSYGFAAPLAYHAPLAYSAHYVAPAIKSGYVAATPGAVHTAPLPEGPHAFSHHLNTAPAPGTF